ncbi:hypothetical protein RHSIM_Rhsim03G0136300 [Rhododendron simsii]|uniref:Eukaryotic translation initiation factor 3 subunit G n=1 Tax=Rhododendron simsii TaxID=118357 RepID=A0A834LUU7_RHOSS|nr:hypothetical protein RHSIM_Rhsim03G0136300 [Rhododendron simsii]
MAFDSRPGSASKPPSKVRWGELEEDDGEDLDFLLPPRQVIGPDENGIKKVIEYKFNDDGNKVKITTTTRVRKLAKARLSKRAVERRSWPKFGDAVHEDVGARLTMVSTEEILLERPRAPGAWATHLVLVTSLLNMIRCRDDLSAARQDESATNRLGMIRQRIRVIVVVMPMWLPVSSLLPFDWLTECNNLVAHDLPLPGCLSCQLPAIINILGFFKMVGDTLMMGSRLLGDVYISLHLFRCCFVGIRTVLMPNLAPQTGTKSEESKAAGDSLAQLGKGGAVLMVCRTCGKKGDHWTSRCPYKDLAPQSEAFSDKPLASETAAAASGGTTTKGAYVPPSLRAGAERPAGSEMRRRNEENSVRVTNLSEDTREPDLHELFRTFGPVSRVYVAIDQKTGMSRGFGFVNFVNKEDAERAIAKLNGYGYDNLILRVEWATPRVN